MYDAAPHAIRKGGKVKRERERERERDGG